MLETSKARIGYIDLTFSAPKSLSIAWAFAPTKAERAIIHQAHTDAIASVMFAIEKEIDRASIGRSAKNGCEPGSIGWASFDHYAARPTVEVIRTDEQGQPFTELHRLTRTDGRVPGDMQVHTHVAVFNAVETESGRLGSLDLAQLEGRIHEWGALYQAYVATDLRTRGVRMELDRRSGMARLSDVPDHVIAQFSKRTLSGTDTARAYARSLGLDWESLAPERKIGLLKSGVQRPPRFLAKNCGGPRLCPSHRAVSGRSDSCTKPRRAPGGCLSGGVPLLEKQFDRRAVIDGSDARIAVAEGLITAGVEAADDVDAITRAFQERGIQRGGENAALIWGMVKGIQGRDRTAITTTLHLREEETLIASARAGSRDRSSALSQKQIEAEISAFPEINFKDGHGRRNGGSSISSAWVAALVCHRRCRLRQKYIAQAPGSSLAA